MSLPWDDDPANAGCCPPPARRRKPEPEHRWCYRGDTLVFNVLVQLPPDGTTPTGDPCENLVPVNLTGWTVIFTAKYHPADQDPDAVIQLTSQGISSPAGGAVAIPVPSTGQVTITTPPLATYQFPDGDVRLVYDVSALSPTGRVVTVEEGYWDLWPDVTRAITPPPVFPTPPQPPVPTLAALAALAPPTAYVAGTFVFVTTTGQTYQLNPLYKGPFDGLNAIPATVAAGGGGWTLFNGTAINPWQQQLAWWIDPVNGKSTNPGTQASPIDSLSTLSTRLGGGWDDLTEQIDVYFNGSDHSGTPACAFRIVVPPGTAGRVIFHGTQTVKASGRLTAAVNRNYATDVPYQLTDPNVSSWTPLAGYYLQLTSGTYAGFTGCLLKDLSGMATPQPHTVRMATFVPPLASGTDIADYGYNWVGWAQVSLAGTETYAVTAPTLLPPVSFELVGSYMGASSISTFPAYQAMFKDVDFQSTMDTIRGCSAAFMNCRFQSVSFALTNAQETGSVYYGTNTNAFNWMSAVTVEQFMYSTGTTVIGADTVLQVGSRSSENGYVMWDFALQDAELTTVGEAEATFLYTGGCFDGADIVANGNSATFNYVSGSGFSWLYEGILWGSAYGTGPDVLKLPNGIARVVSGYVFAYSNVAVGDGTFLLAQSKTAIAYIRPDTGAFVPSITCSFANFIAPLASGGFNLQAVDIWTGTGLHDPPSSGPPRSHVKLAQQRSALAQR